MTATRINDTSDSWHTERMFHYTSRKMDSLREGNYIRVKASFILFSFRILNFNRVRMCVQCAEIREKEREMNENNLRDNG